MCEARVNVTCVSGQEAAAPRAVTPPEYRLLLVTVRRFLRCNWRALPRTTTGSGSAVPGRCEGPFGRVGLPPDSRREPWRQRGRWVCARFRPTLLRCLRFQPCAQFFPVNTAETLPAAPPSRQGLERPSLRRRVVDCLRGRCQQSIAPQSARLPGKHQDNPEHEKHCRCGGERAPSAGNHIRHRVSDEC